MIMNKKIFCIPRIVDKVEFILDFESSFKKKK